MSVTLKDYPQYMEQVAEWRALSACAGIAGSGYKPA